MLIGLVKAQSRTEPASTGAQISATERNGLCKTYHTHTCTLSHIFLTKIVSNNALALNVHASNGSAHQTYYNS